MLAAGIDHGDLAHFRGLQSFLGERHRIFVILDDVDLLSAQLADDRLHPHALHAHAGAYRVHVLVARHDRDLGTLPGFARNGPDNDGVVVDFRHFALKQALHQFGNGPGNDHLGAFGCAVHPLQHHAHALTDGELLQPRLLAFGHSGLGFAKVEDYVLQFKPFDGGVENLT